MPLKMPCPNCRKVLTYGEQSAGKRTRCPQCQAPLVLAGPAGPAPVVRRPVPAAPPAPPSGNPFDFNAAAPAANAFDFHPAAGPGPADDFGSFTAPRLGGGGSWTPLIKGLNGVALHVTFLYLLVAAAAIFQFVATLLAQEGFVSLPRWTTFFIGSWSLPIANYARYACWAGSGIVPFFALFLLLALNRCRRAPGDLGGSVLPLFAVFSLVPALVLAAVVPFVVPLMDGRLESVEVPEGWAVQSVRVCLVGASAFGLFAVFFQAVFLRRLAVLSGNRGRMGSPLLFFLFTLFIAGTSLGIDLGSDQVIDALSERFGAALVRTYVVGVGLGWWLFGALVAVFWYRGLTSKAVEALRRSVRGY